MGQQLDIGIRPARVAQPPAQRINTALLAFSVVTDLLAISAGYLLAAWARAPLPEYWWILIATLPVWPVVFAFTGLYDHRRLTSGWLEMRRVFEGVSLAMFLVILTSFFLDQRDLSRGWTVAAWPICLLTVTAFRFALRKSVHALRNRGRLQVPLAIVGTNDEARSIARSLGRCRWLGYEPAAFIRAPGDPDPAPRMVEDLPVLGGDTDVVGAVRASGAHAVIIASSAVPNGALTTLYRDLQEAGDLDVRLSAGVLNIAASRMAVEPLDGLPMLALRRMQLARSQATVKRAFDIVVAGLLSLVLAPLLTIAAAAVALTSHGPILYRQRRIGREATPFTMLKFRTMVHGAERQRAAMEATNEADGLLFKMREDPRTTRVGRFLRRWSLDELPQLLNVLKGDMSLVGPRPPLPEEVARYDAWLRQRLHVTPGITGLWQVNGRHELTFEDYVRYDLFYVRNWSLALDISVLWRTIPAVLSRRGSW